MNWTAARGYEFCGNCGCKFLENDAMAVLAFGKRRCSACVPGVDWDVVHAVIEARRAQRTGEPVVNVRESFEHAAPGSLNDALKRLGIKGVRRSKVKPFAEVADDPTVARLHAEENQ